MFPPLKNFNLRDWIEASKGDWGPPAKIIFEGSDYITFVVRGPSFPRDFHINPGDEIFYMLAGELHFRYINSGGERKVIEMRSGDIFLLPAGVPHSPQRLDGSWGLVVERKRLPGQLDRQVWFCEKCNNKLYEIDYRFEAPVDATRAVQDGNNMLRSNKRIKTCSKCGEIFSLTY